MKIIFVRSVLLTLALTVPGYASNVLLGDEYCPAETEQANSNATAEIVRETEEQHGETDFIQFNRAQDTLNMVELLSLFPEETQPQKSSPFVKTLGNLNTASAKLDKLMLYQQAINTQIKSFVLPENIKQGFSAKKFYSEAQTSMAAMSARLALPILQTQINELIDSISPMHQLLSEQGQKLFLDVCYKPLMRQWMVLLKAYQDTESVSLYGTTYEKFIQYYKHFNNLFAPFVALMKQYNSRLDECKAIVNTLNQSCSKIEGLTDTEDFSRWNKDISGILQRLNSFLANQDVAQDEFVKILAAQLQQPVLINESNGKRGNLKTAASAGVKFEKQIKRSPLPELREMADALLGYPNEENNNSMSSVEQPRATSATSPKTSRDYQKLHAKAKVKRAPVVAAAAQPATSSAAATRATAISPQLDWLAEKVDWTKHGPKQDSIIVSNQTEFDEWINGINLKIVRQEILQALVNYSFGIPFDDSHDISDGNKYRGKPLKFDEYRYNHHGFVLRIYYCKDHKGRLCILAWGDKNDQDRKIKAAYELRKRIIDQSIDQKDK